MSVTEIEKRAASGGAVLGEAGRRRTFAVISHPDAGKSTLTEALALHAAAINPAGAVHGKAGRRGDKPRPAKAEKQAAKARFKPKKR